VSDHLRESCLLMNNFFLTLFKIKKKKVIFVMKRILYMAWCINL